MSDIRYNQWLHNSGTGGVSQDAGGNIGIGTTSPLIPVGAGNTAILNVGVVTCNSIEVTGNVSVGGTLTYQDVTNIDSVGIVTARQGIHIDDSITHIGDTDTKIRFPAADQIQLETGGTNYLKLHRYSSVNFVEVGSAANLSLADNGANSRSILIGDGNASSTGKLFLQAGGGSSGFGGGIVMYSHANTTNRGGVYIGKSTNSAGSIIFGNGGTSASPEYMRIDSSGRVQIGISTTASSHGNFDDLTIQAQGGGNAGITIVTSTTTQGTIAFSDGTSGTAQYNGYIQYSNNGDILGLGAGGDDRVTIDGNGKVICKAKDQTVGTLDIWGGKTSVTAVDEINAQIRFRSKDTSVSNTDAVGGTIKSITEYSNGAYTGLSFETFRQDRSPQLREALRLDYNGNVKVLNGDLIMGNDKGISFINADDTATGETVSSSVLDDYEEGSCVMNYSPASGSLSGHIYTTGKYVKIGRLVMVTGSISLNGAGSASGRMDIIGWPYAPTGLNSTWSLESGHGVIKGHYNYPDAFNMLVMNNGGTNAYVYDDAGNYMQVGSSGMGTGYNECQCSFTVTYYANA